MGVVTQVIVQVAHPQLEAESGAGGRKGHDLVIGECVARGFDERADHRIEQLGYEVRRIATRVVVDDGESLALGGLIQERDTLSRGQTPVLGDVPVLGNLFKSKTDTINRTELLIFIRPRVVRDVHEARRVTEEFRESLRMTSPIDRRRGGTRLQQNLKRLAH